MLIAKHPSQTSFLSNGNILLMNKKLMRFKVIKDDEQQEEEEAQAEQPAATEGEA